jgi:hypothetical protein
VSSIRLLRLYANKFDRAILALTIDLGADGTVSFSPGEDEAASAFLMTLVGRAVPMPGRPDVAVRPSDGAPYLEAVAATLARTSRWLVVAE